MTGYPATMNLPGLVPKNREFVLAEPPPGALEFSSAVMSATVGTGKTTVAFCRFIIACFRSANWCEEYGESNPLALVTSPTDANITENIVPLFLRHLPPELILEYRTKPSRYMLLANGCKVLFKSGLSLIDSMSVRVLWVDECSNEKTYGPPDKWESIKLRCRDTKGEGPREMVFSGIAEADEKVIERFRDGVQNLVTPGLNDNPGIDEAYRDSVLGTLTEKEAEVAKNGGWRETITGGALHDVLDLRLGANVTEEHGDDGGPVIASIDSGDQAVVLFVRQIMVPELLHGQPTGSMVPGLCAIAEMSFDDLDNRQIIKEAKRFPYEIHEVCLDAAEGINGRNNARDEWKGPLTQLPRGSRAYLRKDKFERLRWACRDAHGTRRLLIHQRLLDSKDRRGLVESLKTSKVDKSGTDFVKNNRTDHIREALAQVVQAKLNHKRSRKNFRKATWKKRR
ncbi:MAG: hypothetical protein AAGJ19_13825 [Myxococcota bacterium]